MARAAVWLDRNFPTARKAEATGPVVMFSYLSERNINSMILGTIVAILKQGQWCHLSIKGGEEAVASMVVAIVQGLGLQYIMDPVAFGQADLDAALNDLFDNVLMAGATASR